MSSLPQRRSIRLPGYDYTQEGAYFITICTHGRQQIFGEIVGEEMTLSTLGCIVDEEWLRTATLRSYVEMDAYVIMPNHLHGIIMINHGYDPALRTQHAASLPSPGGVTPNNIQRQSLSGIVRAFKAAATRRINRVRETPGVPLWQSRFYEHIIRSEQTLNEIRQYILFNPQCWAYDQNNPDRDS